MTDLLLLLTLEVDIATILALCRISASTRPDRFISFYRKYVLLRHMADQRGHITTDNSRYGRSQCSLLDRDVSRVFAQDMASMLAVPFTGGEYDAASPK